MIEHGPGADRRRRRAAAGADLRLVFDPYRGVITYVRVQAGRLPSQRARSRCSPRDVTSHEAEETGVRRPRPTPVAALGPGEVGYLVAGLKDVGQAKVGETITIAGKTAPPSRCPATASRSRWCSRACSRPTATTTRPARGARQAEAQRLRRSPTSPRRRRRSGSGSACGFLGLLHMDIVRERLEREFDLSRSSTAPERRVPRRTDGGADRDRATTRPRCRPPATIDGDRGAVRLRHDDHADATTSAR